MVASSLVLRLSRANLLNETVFNSDDLILSVVSYCSLRKQPLLKALVTKLKRSSNIQVTIIIVESQSA